MESVVLSLGIVCECTSGVRSAPTNNSGKDIVFVRSFENNNNATQCH